MYNFNVKFIDFLHNIKKPLRNIKNHNVCIISFEFFCDIVNARISSNINLFN